MPEVRWAEGPRHRHQAALLGMSLDEQLPADAQIRLVDVILSGFDWEPWERVYSVGGRGRPPIHPRLVAGCILHGMMNRIVSLRDLEAATVYRIDFQWFLNGLTIDFTTFAKFRQQFGPQLKELLPAMSREARRLVAELSEADPRSEVALDGTTMRANSDRHGARTVQRMVRMLSDLERDFDQLQQEAAMLEAMDALDEQTLEQLEKQKARLEAQALKVETALAVARARDEAKRAKDGKNATEVRVPVTDPESSLMPNKDGGHAPNYNATAAVDTQTGLITHAGVAEGGDEPGMVPEAVADTEEALGGKPEKLLCDSAFASGENLAFLDSQGIEMLSPPEHVPEDICRREDPNSPIDQARVDALLKRKGKLSKAFFIYDEELDQWYCPMGRVLKFSRQVTRRNKRGMKHKADEYLCGDCSDCPLSGKCLSRRAKARRVSRDEHQPLRDQLSERMATDEGKAAYARRAPTIEGVFGTIKGGMGIRAFGTRGLRRVRIEWQWICAGYNLKKLVKLLAKAGGSTGPSEPGKQIRTASWKNPLQDLSRAIRYPHSPQWLTEAA